MKAATIQLGPIAQVPIPMPMGTNTSVNTGMATNTGMAFIPKPMGELFGRARGFTMSS